jgi:A nuclease family of the HNH/ENDO VII superfamily with conserved AHH
MAEHASVQGLKKKMWYERDSPPNPTSYPSCGGGWQRHHILPCTSVKRSLIEAAQSKDNLIKGVRYFTNWNINKKTNLIALPTTPVYQQRFGKKGLKKKGPTVGWNLPCHNWAHTRYNEKVIQSLSTIWDNVQIKIDKHNKLKDATDIKGDLEDQRKLWRRKVTTGRVGSLQNWRAMFEGKPGAHNHFTMTNVPDSPV